jgi:hypothetical protein
MGMDGLKMLRPDGWWRLKGLLDYFDLDSFMEGTLLSYLLFLIDLPLLVTWRMKCLHVVQVVASCYIAEQDDQIHVSTPRENSNS